MEMAKIEYFSPVKHTIFFLQSISKSNQAMYNIRRFVGSGKELQELKKALETNDTKIIQKYIEITRQRMVKHNRTNQLKTFEHILKKPRKTQRRKQVKKTTDLWKMFKMIKPRKSYFSSTVTQNCTRNKNV